MITAHRRCIALVIRLALCSTAALPTNAAVAAVIIARTLRHTPTVPTNQRHGTILIFSAFRHADLIPADQIILAIRILGALGDIRLTTAADTLTIWAIVVRPAFGLIRFAAPLMANHALRAIVVCLAFRLNGLTTAVLTNPAIPAVLIRHALWLYRRLTFTRILIPVLSFGTLIYIHG